MHASKHYIGIGVLFVGCIASYAIAEVVDLSHLVEEAEEVIAQADDYERPEPERATPGFGDVDHVLALRLAELEERVARRDRQIAELKEALEEVTNAFSSRLAAMRATQEERQSREVRHLQEALREESTALAEAQRELAALRAERETDLAQDAQVSLAEHEEAIAALEAKHAEDVARLRRIHTAELAAVNASYETLRSDADRERAELQRLQERIDALEDALLAAEREDG